MGVSVLSGALSTLGAVFLMFFAPNLFFLKFASFLFVTIALSCIYSLLFYPALLSMIGPLGEQGELYVRVRALMHRLVKVYVQSVDFVKQEKALRRQELDTEDEEPTVEQPNLS